MVMVKRFQNTFSATVKLRKKFHVNNSILMWRTCTLALNYEAMVSADLTSSVLCDLIPRLQILQSDL